MALYELTNTSLNKLSEKSFAELGVKERQDLQRVLRDHFQEIDADTVIVGEEVCVWDDSNRRIDLLGVHSSGDLVVVELKATSSGGHMELQALRYAAMIRTMTFEQTVDVYADFLQKRGEDRFGAERNLKEHLDLDDSDLDRFGQSVRIVLVSSGFNREITTTALWLNEFGLNLQCLRMIPTVVDQRIVVQIEQVIPLPDAEEYNVRLSQKRAEEQAAKVKSGSDRTLFWKQLLDKAAARTSLHEHAKPKQGSTVGVSAGKGYIYFTYGLSHGTGWVGVGIWGDKNSSAEEIFELFARHKSEIEATFGRPLQWERMEEYQKSKILAQSGEVDLSDEKSWEPIQNAMIEDMIRLERALRPYIDSLP